MRDDHGEERRLDDADPASVHERRAHCCSCAKNFAERDVERDHAPSTAPPTRPMHVGVERRAAAARSTSASTPRQHEHLDRVEAERAHRVDLLVHLHRADLRGEGAARAAGDDDRGQQDAELAQDRDRRPG